METISRTTCPTIQNVKQVLELALNEIKEGTLLIIKKTSREYVVELMGDEE